jgi:hypothetical protein
VRLADGDLAGSVRLTRAHCYSAPAVVGGTLITGDQDGLVHGIRLASDEACELPAISLDEDFLTFT